MIRLTRLNIEKMRQLIDAIDCLQEAGKDDKAKEILIEFCEETLDELKSDA